MKLINCTPHSITIHDTEVLTLPPCGSVARLVGGPPPVETHVSIDGRVVRVTRPPSYEKIEGLPPFDADNAIVVSAMVGAQAPTLLGNKWKGRVFGPDTGADAIRNAAGHIIGVRGLILYW